MGKLTESLERAADHAERLSRALAKVADAGPGGGGGGGNTPSNGVTFNTTIVASPTRGRTVRTGEGSGTGGRDIQSRAFAYFGLSAAGASQAFIAQIIREFERMLAKGALTNRTMAS